MSIRNFAVIGQNIENNGKYHYQYVYKTTLPTPVTAGAFVDLNQTSGVPVYNAFSGSAATFTPLVGSKNQGVYVGPTPTSGEDKYLARMQVLTTTASVPSYVHLCDYLGFYTLIDADSTDVQVMDNSLSISRYSSGEGVRIVFVAIAPMVATANCTVVYTNQDGVTGRTVNFNVFPAANIGVCAVTAGNNGTVQSVTPFVNLVDGDTGVRAIESITFSNSAGGFICACLVKPLANVMMYEASVPTEKVFGIEQQKLPKIEPEAYLNFLIQRGNTASTNFFAELLFVNA